MRRWFDVVQWFERTLSQTRRKSVTQSLHRFILTVAAQSAVCAACGAAKRANVCCGNISFREAVQRLASQEFLRDLPPGLDVVGSDFTMASILRKPGSPVYSFGPLCPFPRDSLEAVETPVGLAGRICGR